MDLHCAVCGKDYWRTQQWMHDKHVVHKPPLVVHKPVVVHVMANMPIRKSARRTEKNG